jgi:hypothetical protein
MKLIYTMNEGREGLLSGIFLSVLSAVLALESLWNAWWHDPYSAGGFLAFLIWLSLLGIASYRLGGQGNTFCVVLSALLCIVGSITSLRVCHHLAFACALCGLAVPIKYGWLAAVAALSWLPATGWFVSRFFAGGLAGWERPTACIILASVFIICWYQKSNKRPNEIQS